MSQSPLTVTRATPSTRAIAIIGLVILAILVAAPWWAGRADLRLLGEFFLYLSLATLWNLMAGYAGLISVGQQAYVGLGGYLLFALTLLLGVHPLVALCIVGFVGMAVAIPVATLIFRLRGAYFAIGTWVIAEVFRLTAAQVAPLGGGSGTSLPASIVRSIASGRSEREMTMYFLALGIAVFVIAIVYFFLRSRRGLALTAIRDNELAASSLGIDIWRTKFVVYVITAALTTIVGAVIFLQKIRISPDAAFSVNDWTAFVIFMVVIGGIGTIEGPIIGTILFFILREYLADLGSIYLMILGLVAIVVMLKAPSGLWGFVKAKFDIQIFPLSHRVMGNAPKESTNGEKA